MSIALTIVAIYVALILLSRLAKPLDPSFKRGFKAGVLYYFWRRIRRL